MTPEEIAARDAANALRGPPARGPPARQQHERSAANINIDKFQSNVDDIETFLELFENSVELATGVEDEARKGHLCKRWLPLKLDDAALATYKQATSTSWKDLKEELIGLLVDPQEKYKWQAKLTTIKWDGKESFHTLASRVKRAVDKFDKDMPQEFKDREYFFRFRAAFKKPMRRFIDMGCPANKRNLDHAKEVALRYQLTLCDEDDGAAGGNDHDPMRAVGFAGAVLHEDRATGIEAALTGMTTQLENLAVTLKSFDDRLRIVENRDVRQSDYRGRNNSRDGRGSSYQGNYRGNNYGSRDNSQSGQGNRGGNRNGNRYDRSGSRDREQNRPRNYNNNNNRDNRDDDRRDGRNDRRDNRDDRRDGRDDRRNDGRNNNRSGNGGNRGNSRDRQNRNDAYRAIDTGDEESSAESVPEDEPRGATGGSGRRGN